LFAFLHAKKARAHVDPDELTALRPLAQAYTRITPPDLDQALQPRSDGMGPMERTTGARVDAA
jgi:hypothetical protein